MTGRGPGADPPTDIMEVEFSARVEPDEDTPNNTTGVELGAWVKPDRNTAIDTAGARSGRGLGPDAAKEAGEGGEGVTGALSGAAAPFILSGWGRGRETWTVGGQDGGVSHSTHTIYNWGRCSWV